MSSYLKIEGPGGVLAAHPALYAIALLGASGAGIVFAVKMVRASGIRRFGWAVLTAFQAVQVIGIARVKNAAAERLTAAEERDR